MSTAKPRFEIVEINGGSHFLNAPSRSVTWRHDGESFNDFFWRCQEIVRLCDANLLARGKEGGLEKTEFRDPVLKKEAYGDPQDRNSLLWQMEHTLHAFRVAGWSLIGSAALEDYPRLQVEVQGAVRLLELCDEERKRLEGEGDYNRRVCEHLRYKFAALERAGLHRTKVCIRHTLFERVVQAWNSQASADTPALSMVRCQEASCIEYWLHVGSEKVYGYSVLDDAILGGCDGDDNGG